MIDRRRFLKRLTVASAAAALGVRPGQAGAEPAPEMNLMQRNIRDDVRKRLNCSRRDGLDLDVAIIGAGVSGLYSAWRVLAGKTKTAIKTDRKPRVHIFESSDCIGGRLESVKLPGMEVVGELGGMRYLAGHEIVASLIDRVFRAELKSIPFETGDRAKLYFYARTQRCRRDAWTVAQGQGGKFATNFFLRHALAGWDQDQLFNKIIYDVLVADPWFKNQYGSKVKHSPPYGYAFELSGEDWDDVKPRLTYKFTGPYQGMKVNELGFWNLIRHQVGDEAYEFLSVAGGYYSNTINWNAAEAFPYMVRDFSKEGVTYKTIEGGYDQIAYALAKAYLDQPGSEIWSGNVLETFEKAPAGSPRRYKLKIHNKASTPPHWFVYADAIVLAMPRRSVELLAECQSEFFARDTNADLWRNIDSVIPQPAFKLLMGFERPWWQENFGATAGESITDLPIRQCYYFGVDPVTKHSLFLASYGDMQAVSFWETLEAEAPKRHELFQPRATRCAPGPDVCALQSVQATKVMVEEAMAQVREVHGRLRTPIPDPYVTYFKDWTKDPFGAGYHAWKAGVDVQKVMRYMRQPWRPDAIHICGEAYSDQQGWVEGALCVAERMLQDHFHLEWPPWLDRKYDLGW